MIPEGNPKANLNCIAGIQDVKELPAQFCMQCMQMEWQVLRIVFRQPLSATTGAGFLPVCSLPSCALRCVHSLLVSRVLSLYTHLPISISPPSFFPPISNYIYICIYITIAAWHCQLPLACMSISHLLPWARTRPLCAWRLSTRAVLIPPAHSRICA